MPAEELDEPTHPCNPVCALMSYPEFAALRRRLLPLLAAAIVIAGGGSEALAVDLTDARLMALERKLFDATVDARRSPRSADYLLDSAARQLHWLEVEAWRDPEVEDLRRQVQGLRWQAQRRIDLRALGASRRQACGGGVPVPDDRHTLHGTDLQGRALPLGTGKLYILLQRRLMKSELDLARGMPATAVVALDEAEDMLAELSADRSGRIPKDDPNLVAARSQIAALKERLGQAEDRP
jgi:hypothetical protein